MKQLKRLVAIACLGFSFMQNASSTIDLEVSGSTSNIGTDPIQVKEQGIASWYGPGFHGKTTANGERFDTTQFTAAHKSLPFDSMVSVTRLDTQKEVVVRINDRGPFVPGRIIDLSRAAAEVLELVETGVTWVELEIMQIRDGEVPLIGEPNLVGRQVRSWQHKPGQLLVLSSGSYPVPIIVRVVKPKLMGVSNGLMVSPNVATLLGDRATIIAD